MTKHTPPAAGFPRRLGPDYPEIIAELKAEADAAYDQRRAGGARVGRCRAASSGED
jgi:hypothetical protein